MGVRQDFVNWLRASKVLPQQMADMLEIPARATRYGELIVAAGMPNRQQLVDEGSYFVTTNPTPQSVLAYGAAGTQTAFSDTVPFIQLINTANPADPNAPVVYPDYLKLIQIGGTAPATTTSVGLAVKVDNGFRAATAGTPVQHTPVSPNMNLANKAPVGRVVVHTGAVATIPAASAAARLVGRAHLKGGPTLLLDEYTLQHGANADGAPNGGYLTTVAAYTTRLPPVGVGPGQSLTYHLFFPGGATNPFSYEYELGHFER